MSKTNASISFDLFVTLLGRLGGIALSFLATVLVVRNSSKEIAGVYFFLLSTVSLLTVFISFGINTVASGVMARFEKNGGTGSVSVLVKIFLQIMVITTAICIVLSWLLSQSNLHIPIDVFFSDRFYFYALIVLSALFCSISIVAGEVLRFNGRFKFASVSGGFLNNIIFIILVCAAIEFFYWGPLSLTVVYFLSMLISGCVFLSKLQIGYKAVSTGSLYIKDLVRRCIPIMLTNFGAFSITQANILIVSIYFLPEDGALFGSSARLAMVLTVLPGVIQSVVYPALARAHAGKDMIKIENIMRASASLSFLGTLPIALPMLLIPEFTLGFVFGNQYFKSGVVLQILVLSAIINASKGFSGGLLLICGCEKIQAKLTILVGILSLTMLFVAAHFNQLYMIAVIGVLTTCMQGGGEMLLAKRHLGVRSYASFHFILNPLLSLKTLGKSRNFDSSNDTVL